MDSWFDRGRVPATRCELHWGGRIVRCFVERPRSVRQMLEKAVARRAHGAAIICGDEKVTYAELDALVGAAAGGLKALGVEKGDRVAILLGNSIEFVVVLFAVARLGALSVPLNIRHQLAENRHILEDCAAKVVVHEHDLSDRIAAPSAQGSLRMQSPSGVMAARRSPSCCTHCRFRRLRSCRKKRPRRSFTLPARLESQKARW